MNREKNELLFSVWYVWQQKMNSSKITEPTHTQQELMKTLDDGTPTRIEKSKHSKNVCKKTN